MTGGMGDYSPTPLITSSMLANIERQILIPAVDGLKRDGIEYTGVLYAGLMITPNGPKVLEFNCRFGDPETQPLMMRLKSDLTEVLLATAEGRLNKIDLNWDPRPAICVVAASGGYSGSFKSGVPISGVEKADSMGGVEVFAAGYAGPAVADGRVYVTDRVAGEDKPGDPFQRGKYPGLERVFCISAADGKVIWQKEYSCDYTMSYAAGPRATPAVSDGKVYTV